MPEYILANFEKLALPAHRIVGASTFNKKVRFFFTVT